MPHLFVLSDKLQATAITYARCFNVNSEVGNTVKWRSEFFIHVSQIEDHLSIRLPSSNASLLHFSKRGITEQLSTWHQFDFIYIQNYLIINGVIYWLLYIAHIQFA
jgi:hypothetical protein